MIDSDCIYDRVVYVKRKLDLQSISEIDLADFLFIDSFEIYIHQFDLVNIVVVHHCIEMITLKRSFELHSLTNSICIFYFLLSLKINHYRMVGCARVCVFVNDLFIFCSNGNNRCLDHHRFEEFEEEKIVSSFINFEILASIIFNSANILKYVRQHLIGHKQGD